MKRKVVPEGFTNNGWEKILTFFLNSGRHNALQCTTFDKNLLHQFLFCCHSTARFRKNTDLGPVLQSPI